MEIDLKKLFIKTVSLVVCLLLCGLASASVLISFDTPTGQLYDDFPGWHYSSPVHNPVGYMVYGGGFYADPDGAEQIRAFYPYYNYYNSDHMGWLRWGYADVESDFSVAGSGCFKYICTGGAYDNHGVVAYDGLEVKYKEQFEAYLAAGIKPCADLVLPGGISLYIKSSISSNTALFSETQGCDRLSLWVWLPQTVNHGEANHPIQTVSYYPFIDDSGGDHYYHDVTNIGMGGWTHILFDAHPIHNNSGDSNPYDFYRVGGYDCPGNAIEYFNRTVTFALRINDGGLPLSPMTIYLDEIEFYKVSEPENDETIVGIGVGYDAGHKIFDIGFCDKYRGSVCEALYEVRYSFSPITNANYSVAKLCTVIQNEAVNFSYVTGNQGEIQKTAPGYSQIWGQLKLDLPDEGLLVAGQTIYFVVKDISERSFPDRDPYDEEFVNVPGVGDLLWG